MVDFRGLNFGDLNPTRCHVYLQLDQSGHFSVLTLKNPDAKCCF
jgi:hypothetical protein